MDVSLIIPAFNESKKIAKDVLAANNFFQANDLYGEIFIVDDGSQDKTADIARHAAAQITSDIHVIRLDDHHGKGYAVRTGIIKSQGDFVMFADSGLCVPFSYALKGVQLIRSGQCDIAHGSRKLKNSIIHRPQPGFRRFISRIMRLIFVYGLRIPKLSDTQCGFKIYKGKIARHLYSQSRCDGFLFDIEIIALAQHNEYRICEFPIEWTADLDSRLSPTRSFKQIMLELNRIQKRLKHIRTHS